MSQIVSCVVDTKENAAIIMAKQISAACMNFGVVMLNVKKFSNSRSDMID
jgi:hypothetical protein